MAIGHTYYGILWFNHGSQAGDLKTVQSSRRRIRQGLAAILSLACLLAVVLPHSPIVCTLAWKKSGCPASSRWPLDERPLRCVEHCRLGAHGRCRSHTLVLWICRCLVLGSSYEWLNPLKRRSHNTRVKRLAHGGERRPREACRACHGHVGQHADFINLSALEAVGMVVVAVCRTGLWFFASPISGLTAHGLDSPRSARGLAPEATPRAAIRKSSRPNPVSTVVKEKVSQT